MVPPFVNSENSIKNTPHQKQSDLGVQKENPVTVSDEVDPVTMELFSMVNEATQDERQVMLEMLRLLRKQRKENV